MTTKLYDHEFSPFTIDGGRRIVAPEAEWRRVRAFARENGAARVRVPVDVFEPWDGPMVDAAGRHLWVNENDELEVQLMPGRSDILFYEQKYKPLRMADVRRLTFALIDECPSVTWTLETSHPENVAAMMPAALTCQPAYGTCKRLKGYSGQHSQQPEYLPNLWLYARADSQADADARIPHLLQVPAAVRGLVMTPREVVDLRPKAPDTYAILELYNTGNFDITKMRPANDRVLNCFPKINHVIIRGGAEPMHPDHVRSLVRQCEAAGVPVWCETPVDGRTWNQLPEGQS